MAIELDHYGDGVWYDAEYVHIRGDVPYYERVARAHEGTLLELACGTGRLSFPMAATGRSVVGIDAAPSMIEQAEAKRRCLPQSERDRLTFHLGDMRKVRLGQTFSAVVVAFNTIMHMLSDDDLYAALLTARAHLPTGGRFYLDLHTPLIELLARDPHGRYDPQQMIDPRTGHRFIVTENNDYDHRRQINTMRFYYQRVDEAGRPIGPERRAQVRLRVLFPRELDVWLDLAGFETVEDWDDFERSRPFTGKSGRRVVVAARR